ncbi:MAG: DNA-directed RNA polymerase subunit D [Candidatus Bathyarchaeota archaeon]|nr:DNA-directed RNA polymerase subunit D [Candidatus Bathyarchaeota archaeon]
MRVTILEKSDLAARLIIEGISPPLANTLRRISLSEVPVMAIDDIVIYENSSVLHDEILALRLGLIPLKTDLDSYNLPEKCTCKSELGCSLCRVVLTLNVEAKGGVRTVYSGDLVSENPNIVPVSDKIPIVKLAPGQRIMLEAYAKLGRGKDHAKWQPVSACNYRYKPIVNIDYARCDGCGKCADICPKRVFAKEGDKIVVVREMDCILCTDCVRVCGIKPPPIQISWDDSTFIFYIESTGSLPVDRIIFEALKIYEEKFTEFMELLKGLRE